LFGKYIGQNFNVVQRLTAHATLEICWCSPGRARPRAPPPARNHWFTVYTPTIK